MKKNKLFAQVLQSMTKYFLILVVIVMVGIACSGIRVVDSGNVALILRFGKLVGDTPEEQIHEPGLLLAFPYIIDEVVLVPTGSVIEQSVTTYYTPDGTRTVDGSYVITGDQNIAVLSASVKYAISDPVAYALNVGQVGSVSRSGAWGRFHQSRNDGVPYRFGCRFGLYALCLWLDGNCGRFDVDCKRCFIVGGFKCFKCDTDVAGVGGDCFNRWYGC